MAQGSVPVPNPSSTRGAGTELWLIRPGTLAELHESLRAFADTRFGRVLYAGENQSVWAQAFAEASGATAATSIELEPPAAAAPDSARAQRTWSALEEALGSGATRILAVLPAPLLGLVVAHALGFPLAHASALRVDAGRAVLLRDDPLGIVLRRSNARAPERELGTPLPSGRREAR